MSAHQLSHRVLVIALIAAAACSGAPESERTVEQLVVTCVDLPASEDAMLSSTSINSNYGSRLSLRTSWKFESLLRFDLGSIPQSAAIESSTLKLYITSAETCSNNVDFHRATASWDESTVTYASFDQAFDGTVLGSIAITCAPVQK